MKTEFTFNEICLDALRQVGTIGLSNAMTSLSTMIDAALIDATLSGQGAAMSSPHVGVIPLAEFAEMAGGAESVAACIYMPVNGDVAGHVAFLLLEASAYTLADYLMGLPAGTTVELDEIACSALMEVGNILVSSYMVAISDLTGLSLLASPPAFAMDMTAAILDSVASTFAEETDMALTILTRIGKVGDGIEGFFVFVPEPGSLPRLFKALGIEDEANQRPPEWSPLMRSEDLSEDQIEYERKDQSENPTQDQQANQSSDSLSPRKTSAAPIKSRECAA